MNTRRPEWNDANNALVGYGLSMVTLCYLRRFLVSLAVLLENDSVGTIFGLKRGAFVICQAIEKVFRKFTFMLKPPSASKTGRPSWMNWVCRAQTIVKVSTPDSRVSKSALNKPALLAFIDLAKAYLDHSIAQNQRDDGLLPFL